jgi:hypothetical protein
MTPATRLDISNWKIPKDTKLSDEQFNETGRIDLLIGADLHYEISRSGRYIHTGNYPVIQETALGWTLAGRIPASTTLEEAKRAFLQRETNRMEYIIKHFWEVDSMEPSTMTAEQKACQEYSHTHNPTGKRESINKHPTKLELNKKHLASLHSEDHVQLIASWDEVQN